MKWIVFTDLDGTLLNAADYSFSPAKPALKFLKENNVPVVPCTSKTLREVVQIRTRLQLRGPFIVENGSAVFWPADRFAQDEEARLFNKEFRVTVLGKTYTEILTFYEQIKKRFRLKIKGFNEMTTAEIARLTNMTESEALAAKERLYSEPFIAEAKITNLTELAGYAKQNGFQLLRGNRFFHLLGQTDKGCAVRKTLRLYESEEGNVRVSLGLGDSPNDFAMLRVTDYAVLIRRPAGDYASGLSAAEIYRTRHEGPAGWNEAVFHFLKNAVA